MGTVQMVIITKHDSFFCELRVSTVQEKLITAALLISSLFCGKWSFGVPIYVSSVDVARVLIFHAVTIWKAAVFLPWYCLMYFS